MQSIAPNFFVYDLPASVAFYEQLGFKVVMSVPETEPPVWVMMSNEQVNIMFQTFESLSDELPAISRSNGASLLLYIQVKGIRDLYDSVKDKMTILKPLEKTFYGATEFSLLDINNYVLTFAEDE